MTAAAEALVMSSGGPVAAANPGWGAVDGQASRDHAHFAAVAGLDLYPVAQRDQHTAEAEMPHGEAAQHHMAQDSLAEAGILVQACLSNGVRSWEASW